jgi:hypothetical protein
MVRRITIILVCLLASLAACATPAAPPPTVAPPPTALSLPSLQPVGPTILSSDLGKAVPTRAATQKAAAPTLPIPTAAPLPTPAAGDFDSALRPQFASDLNLVFNKTIYTMKWELNDDVSQLQGTQRVIFANRTDKALNELYFRLFANYPKGEGRIQVKNVRIGGGRAVTALEAQDTALRVSFGRPLAPGAVAILEMEYQVQIPRSSPIRYADFTREDWITTLPTVYPIIPAYDAQGWHIEVPPPYGDLLYADSSIYDVTIATPSQYNVIASGQLVRETTEGVRTTRRFIAAPMRDFDANITNGLTKTSALIDDVTINSWYLPVHADAGKRALDWTVNSFKVYERRFGAYPFKELDLVETPTSAGGIEYPGVITVASNLYTDPGQLNYFEFATAHETAHQWFYSTVGNDQVNHPWLDEALVQYATLIYFEDRDGKDTARNIQKSFFDKQYEAAKSKYGDRPAGLPVSAYDENEYGAFVYAKAPKFFQAVRDQIGDDAFFQALRSYYEQFKFRIAQPQDLINQFNQASGQDLTPLFQKWIGA